MRAALAVAVAAFLGCAGPDVSDSGPFECRAGILGPGESYLLTWQCASGDCVPSEWASRAVMEIEGDGDALRVVFNDDVSLRATHHHPFPDLPSYYCLAAEGDLLLCPEHTHVEGGVATESGDVWVAEGCLL